MRQIKHSVYIRAVPSRVYEAIVRAPELSQWWARCETDGKQGGYARFEFEPGNFAKMRLDKLLAAKRIIWRCVDHHCDGNRDFEGTTIEFNLKPEDAGTRVEFVHSGWSEAAPSFELCSIGWEHFLAVSLKNFVENGQGQPHDQAAALIVDKAARLSGYHPVAAQN